MHDPTTFQPEPGREPGSDAQLGEERRRVVARRCYVELVRVQAEDERTADVALMDDAPG